MSTFKRFTNKKGQVIVDMQATLHEDTTNTMLNLYANKAFTTMPNEDYNKPENKEIFKTDTPFWLAKVIVADDEAIKYLTENFNTELYNGKVNYKCIKRKYMPSVFSPMFFDENGNKINGVIPKGSYVNIRSIEETYTTKQNGSSVTAKKLTMVGISIIEDNTSTGAQEVKSIDKGSDTENMMKYMKVLMAELKASRVENEKIMKDNAAIIDGLLEIRDELKKELVEVKEELKEVKASVAEVKEKACQNNVSSLQCKEEDEAMEIMEESTESIEKLEKLGYEDIKYDQQKEEAKSYGFEDGNFDDDIPF